MTKVQIAQIATVVGVPIFLALVKLVIPSIPKPWLPLLCPIIGAVVDVLTSGTIGSGTTWGAVLGMAGNGLREIFDQWAPGKEGSGGQGTGGALKGLKLMGLMGLMGLMACGCASVTQTASSEITDPKTGVVTKTEAVSKIRALGDAKQAVEKVRASAGKTMSVGASGVENESSTEGLKNILQALVTGAVEMGKASATGGASLAARGLAASAAPAPDLAPGKTVTIRHSDGSTSTGFCVDDSCIYVPDKPKETNVNVDGTPMFLK